MPGHMKPKILVQWLWIKSDRRKKLILSIDAGMVMQN